MKRWVKDWVALIVVGVISIVITVCASGCQTYKAVTETPEETWQEIERILLALWSDVISIVDLIL